VQKKNVKVRENFEMVTGEEKFILTRLFITLPHIYRIRHKTCFGIVILRHLRIWRTRIRKGLLIIKHNPLRMFEPYDLPAFLLKPQFVPRSKHAAFVLQTSQLMCEELTAVCSEIRRLHVDALCG
jgi:hypothetical protein